MINAILEKYEKKRLLRRKSVIVSQEINKQSMIKIIY
jgi:hypothetical protein